MLAFGGLTPVGVLGVLLLVLLGAAAVVGVVLGAIALAKVKAVSERLDQLEQPPPHFSRSRDQS
jgi:hypothetical protein